MRKNVVRIGSWFVGVALLAWVFRQMDVEEAWQALSSARVDILLYVPVIALLGMILRAWRWRLLFASPQPALPTLFSTMMIGYLGNNLLPARLGDFLRAYLLGARVNLAKSAVLATVAIERAMETLILALMVYAAVLFFAIPDWLERGGVVMGAGVLLAIAGLVALSLMGEAGIVRLLSPLQAKMPALATRLKLVILNFASGLHALSRPRTGSAFLILSMIIWGSELLLAWLFLAAFGFDLEFWQCWIIMLFVAFSSAIPALPAQIGAFEFSVIAGLSALGAGGGTAAAVAALVWHVVVVAFTSGLGAICIGLSGLPRNPGQLMKKLDHDARSDW